jgi:hypothetical protein
MDLRMDTILEKVKHSITHNLAQLNISKLKDLRFGDSIDFDYYIKKS